MKDATCSPMFWDHCMEWVARVNHLTAKSMYQLRGESRHTTVFGEEGDISILGDFTFYEIIYFDHKRSYPLSKERMGRYLGPSTYRSGERTLLMGLKDEWKGCSQEKNQTSA